MVYFGYALIKINIYYLKYFFITVTWNNVLIFLMLILIIHTDQFQYNFFGNSSANYTSPEAPNPSLIFSLLFILS